MKFLATSSYHNPTINTSECRLGLGLGLTASHFTIIKKTSTICCIICVFYILNYPVMYSLSERVAVNRLRTVFTLTRLKIVPTIKNLIYIEQTEDNKQC